MSIGSPRSAGHRIAIRAHLIWMDMRMPALDGYAATRQIRDHSGGDATRIIALAPNRPNGDKHWHEDSLLSLIDEVAVEHATWCRACGILV